MLYNIYIFIILYIYIFFIFIYILVWNISTLLLFCCVSDLWRKPHLFFLNLFTPLHRGQIPPGLQNMYLLIQWAFTEYYCKCSDTVVSNIGKNPCPEGAYILLAYLFSVRGDLNQRSEDFSEIPAFTPCHSALLLN